MHLTTSLVGLASLLWAITTQAHMQLTYPAPFNATNNPHRTTPPDPYLQYPYDCCGPNDRWTYPCRGYQSLLNTPDGAPTANWQAGSTQQWSIAGIGNHYGGSCQVGFSVDGGETFRVATSYEGNCPHRTGGLGPEGQEFGFTVPEDLDAGVAVFAWVWYNREQEFNMNCAAVNITTADASSPASSCASGVAASAASASETAPRYETTITDTVFVTASSPTLTTPYAPASKQESDANSETWTTSYISTTPSAASHTTSTLTGTEAAGILKTRNNCTCTCPDPDEISSCTCYCFDPSSSFSSSITGNHKRQISFNARPQMLIADDGNGCLTPHTTAELKYPDPGPDIVMGDGAYPLQLPSGNCGAPGTQAYDGSSGNDGHGGSD